MKGARRPRRRTCGDGAERRVEAEAADDLRARRRSGRQGPAGTAGVREEVADVAREDRGLRDGADDVAGIGRRKDVGAAEERVVGVRAKKSKLSDLKKNLRMKRKQN